MFWWAVWLDDPGRYRALTLGRDPTTARHGSFWLLSCLPDPVRPSLANLHPPGLLQRAHVDGKPGADARSP